MQDVWTVAHASELCLRLNGWLRLSVEISGTSRETKADTGHNQQVNHQIALLVPVQDSIKHVVSLRIRTKRLVHYQPIERCTNEFRNKIIQRSCTTDDTSDSHIFRQ